MAIASINPATGETLEQFTPHDAQAVEERLARAAHAAQGWRAMPIAERARIVAELGALLSKERDALGRTMTLEMGKLLTAAVEEAEKCAVGCRYYASNADALLAPRVIVDDANESGVVRYDPLGVILAVMPWNFPFWQVVRFAAPALVAGNVVLLKHASNVPQCALALEDLVRRAGAPDGVFQTLLIESAGVASVLSDRRVAAATLTGSTLAGRAVGALAGRELKKTVLELGGSDPFIILPSADVERAAKVAVTARTINNGQSCIAAKRFIVHREVANDFSKRFVSGMGSLRIGDPLDPGTDIGPLATNRTLEDLEHQVSESMKLGARVLTGGSRRPGPGFFYTPTVLADIPPEAPAAREELFGPVASLFIVDSADEAMELANNTDFGLGASVWTTDADEANRCAERLDAGSVFINGMVSSDPRFPFGGVKQSGYGRELADVGMHEFVNIKTVRTF